MEHDDDFNRVLERLSITEPDRLTLGRRSFLQAAAIGGALAATPWYLQRKEAWAAPIGANDGVLIIIMQGGGNDYLNTVVPYQNGKYYDLRKSLAIPQNKVLPLRDGLGFHPNLVGLKSLWDNQKVAIVNGVGYPSSSLSHFDAIAYWMAGHAQGRDVGTGWLGRYLDGLGHDPFHAIQLGRSAPPHVRGATTVATVLPTFMDKAFGADRTYASNARTFDAVKALAGPQRGALAGRVGTVGRDSVDLASSINAAFAGVAKSQGLAHELALCAKLVNADLGIRIFAITHDVPYDTHADQARYHDPAMAELDAAIGAFYSALAAQWRARVTLMTFGEFGRRPVVNGSAGTDHGTSNCMLIVGDRVKGGMYGQYPSLTDLDGNGDLRTHVDFRQVYASVLGTWLGADAGAILGANYGDLGLFTGGPSASAPGEDHGIPFYGGMNPGPGAYWLATSEGPVSAFGDAKHYGNPPFGTKIVGMAPRPQLDGYWLVSGEGEVFAFGGAQNHGQMKGTPLNSPIVDIVATSSGKGYWLVGRDGGVFSYGDAAFYGSTGGLVLNQPVVGMASHPTGKGYWFVAADGGVFTYGPDCKFHGSTSNLRLNQPVVAIAPSPSGKGYWLVAADGGVFAFGDAPFHGSTGDLSLAQPIIGITPTPGGKGYWFVASDGGLFAFGDAPFHGSLAGRGATIVAMGG